MAESDPSGVRIAGIGGIAHYYGRFRKVNPMTDEQRAAKIRALIEEREGYRRRGEQSRVDLVDKALRDLGAQGAPAVERAARRVVTSAEVRGEHG